MTQSARSLLVRRCAALAGAAAVALTTTMAPVTAAVAAPAPPPLDAVRASPYLYLQNARSVDPARLIKATGLTWVTVGFIAPAGGTRCEPAWADGAWQVQVQTPPAMPKPPTTASETPKPAEPTAEEQLAYMR